MSENTNQRRKKAMQEKQRKRKKMIRRRRMVFFGGFAIVVAALVLVVVILAKSLLGTIVSTNTLTLTDKNVIFEEVSSEDGLDKKEIKSYAKDVIKEFNSASGKTLVKLDTVKEKKDTVYVKTSYESVDAYSEFSGYEAFCGNIEDAFAAGYDFSTTFVSVKDGKKGDVADTETVTAKDGYKVLIVRENATFVVNGEILYVSDENTTVKDGSTVSTVSEDGTEDSAVLTYIIYK